MRKGSTSQRPFYWQSAIIKYMQPRNQAPECDIWELLTEAVVRLNSWCRRAQRGTLLPSLSSEHCSGLVWLHLRTHSPVAAEVTASAVTRTSTQTHLMVGAALQVSVCPVLAVSL